MNRDWTIIQELPGFVKARLEDSDFTVEQSFHESGLIIITAVGNPVEDLALLGDPYEEKENTKVWVGTQMLLPFGSSFLDRNAKSGLSDQELKALSAVLAAFEVGGYALSIRVALLVGLSLQNESGDRVREAALSALRQHPHAVGRR